MKRSVYIGVFCLALALPQLSRAELVRVCGNCPETSLEKAVANAKPDDEISVKGTFFLNDLHIDKPLKITGNAVLSGNGQYQILSINSDNVTIDGLTFKDVGHSYTSDLAAVRINGARNVIVRNCTLENAFFAIYLAKAKNCLVENNFITGKAEREMDSGNGIHAWYCDDVTIRNNTVSGHRDGIYFEFVNNSLIERNSSEHNIRYGLHFMFSNHDEYRNNVFKDNAAGVAVMYSRFIRMADNNFSDNWSEIAHGILLKEISDSEIRLNVFESNTVALYMEGCNRNEIENNLFERNGWAAKVLGNCEGNSFRGNNFIANIFDVTTNSSSNRNTYESNFWSEYSGYDLDRDGIGDVPHRPVKLFTYVIEQVPSASILLRSLFVDLLSLAEKVAPSITPSDLADPKPLMKKVLI